MFHSFDANRPASEWNMHPSDFKHLIDALSFFNTKFISADQIAKSKTDDVVLTFDDGFQSQLPIIADLANRNIPVVVFIITSKIGQVGYFSIDDIKYLLSLKTVTLGAHSVNHDSDKNASDDHLIAEMVISRQRLQAIIGRQVNDYAWPFGIHSLESTLAAGSINLRAYGANSKSQTDSAKSIELPRINIDGRCALAFNVQSITSGTLRICQK